MNMIMTDNYPEITAIIGDSIIEDDSEDSVITDNLGTTSDNEGDTLLIEREEEVTREGTGNTWHRRGS